MTRKRVIAFGAVCIMFLSIGLFSATQDEGSSSATPAERQTRAPEQTDEVRQYSDSYDWNRHH